MPFSKQELETKLAALPSGAAGRLRGIMLDSSFHGVISAADAAALAAQLGITLQQLALNLVPFAQLYALAPISNFQVGAVSIGLSGALYYGSNLEVAGQALSFTVHAEQATTANAWLIGEQGLSALAISAAPCGYCRQFLYELVDASTLEIVLSNELSQLLTYFLPDAFGPHDLGVQGGLMQPQSHGLIVQQSLDQTATAALAAANASYSPYTSTFAGVALRTSGGIYTGRYAENAAYNPSMSPLEAALSQLVLNNQPFDSIVEAVLVEARGPASQVGATQTVLSSVTSTQLTVYAAVTA
jgi:cytidine deaminase